MNPIPELGPLLKQLRLSGILDSLEARNREAIDLMLAYTDFLALLIQDEIARREQKKFTSRLRRASFRIFTWLHYAATTDARMTAKSGNSRLCAISSQKLGGELPFSPEIAKCTRKSGFRRQMRAPIPSGVSPEK
jgi:hypothetical protein